MTKLHGLFFFVQCKKWELVRDSLEGLNYSSKMSPQRSTSTGSKGIALTLNAESTKGAYWQPYLFLIVGEVLTHIIKKTCVEGMIRGISLPCGSKRHTISQYANDSLFMVRGNKQYIDELVRLLKLFGEASCMEINWEKSCAYWFDKYTHKPDWLASYN